MVTTRSASASSRSSVRLSESDSCALSSPRGASTSPPHSPLSPTSLDTPESAARTARRPSHGQPLKRSASAGHARLSLTAPPALRLVVCTEDDEIANAAASAQTAPEFEPLLGRESEYDAILSFVSSRLENEHCKALFIFGACGCGKTSTVLRAMRAISHRVMSTDRVVATRSRSSSSGGGSASTQTPLTAHTHITSVTAASAAAATTNLSTRATHAAALSHTRASTAAAAKTVAARSSTLLRDCLIASIAASTPPPTTALCQPHETQPHIHARKRTRPECEADSLCAHSAGCGVMHMHSSSDEAAQGATYTTTSASVMPQTLSDDTAHACNNNSNNNNNNNNNVDNEEEKEEDEEVVRYSHCEEPLRCEAAHTPLPHEPTPTTRVCHDARVTARGSSGVNDTNHHTIDTCEPFDSAGMCTNRAREAISASSSVPARWSMAYFAWRYPLLFAHLMPRGAARRGGSTAYHSNSSSRTSTTVWGASLSSETSHDARQKDMICCGPAEEHGGTRARGALHTNALGTEATMWPHAVTKPMKDEVCNDRAGVNESPTTMSSLSVPRVVQAHYVNCADLTAAQLVEAIHGSMLRVFPRPDGHTRALADAVWGLGKGLSGKDGSKSRRSSSDFGMSCVSRTCGDGAAAAASVLGPHVSAESEDSLYSPLSARLSSCGRVSRSRGARRSGGCGASMWGGEAACEYSPPSSPICARPSASARRGPPLHVLVLDEVEYARPGSQSVITQLASLSFSHFSLNLSLVFISNQRDLVHVPPMLLSELAFPAYSVETLRQLAQQTMARYLEQQQPQPQPQQRGRLRGSHAETSTHHAKSTAAEHTRTPVAVSPSLYDYIARKVLFHDSGDVRQLVAMCRCVMDAGSAEAAERLTRRNDAQAAEVSCGQTGLHKEEQHEHDNNNKENVPEQLCAAKVSLSGTNLTRAAQEGTSPSANSDSEAATTRTRMSGRSGGCRARGGGESPLHVDAAAAMMQPPLPLGDAEKMTHTGGSSRTAIRRVCNSSSSNITTSSLTKAKTTRVGDVTATKSLSCNASPTSSLTLAKGVKALQSSAVSEQLHTHISTMPEQMLYVLCCLIVLTLRNEKERQLAAGAIGGVRTGSAATISSSLPGSSLHRPGGLGSTALYQNPASSHAMKRMADRPSSSALMTRSRCGQGGMRSGVGSNTLRVREVHQLYTALMGERHFPAMNAAGVTTAIDGLADLGILTRPQKRGNEEVFTFNGVWSVEAMQGALTSRGEELQREMTDCGLDGSENKFVAVLCDLKRLTGVTY